MSKYSDIKKRVTSQRGSTDNNSESGYSASGAYYDIKKKIKTQGTKYDIDDEYLDSFYSDAKSFLVDADSDYNNNSYSTAKANNENYKSRWSDLNSRAEYIRSYINSRKNSIDDKTYSGMMSYLDQFNNASRQYLSAFRNASNYYSQWKTEDEYNDAVEAQKIREEMLSYDLDTGKKDLDALKAVRDTAEEASKNRRNVTYNDLVSAYTRAGYGIQAKAKAKADYEAIQANNSKVDSEIVSILEGAGYSTIDELNDAISKKSAYYNQSKRLQDSSALYDEAKSASDFSQYASVGDALSNEKRDGFFVSEYDKKNKIGYLRNNPEAMDALEKGATRAGNDPLNYPVYKAAKYMTNKEYKAYSYYLGKGDTETAEKYVSYLDYELNQRAANATYKIREGNTLSELIFGVEAGLDQFKSGIKNLFNTNDEYIAPSYIQYASEMVRKDLADDGFNIFGSSLGQIGYDLITTTSNMMPSILTSSLVGMANPVAGTVVGAGLMGASAAGNAYQEMLNLGYDKGQARTYSTLTGLSEAGLQYVLGGIGKLGGAISGKSIESISKGINNAAARFAIQFGGEMASEGLEEFLQDILDPYFKSFATKEFLEIPEGYLEQAVYSGMLGALSAGVLNGFDRATNRVMEYGAAQQIKDEGKVNELVKVGKLFSADTVAYKLADKVTDNTGAWKLSKLLHEVNANLSEQNQADIKYNLVTSGMREVDADTITEWLAKAVDGGKLTSLQQKALDENPIISRVFKKVIIDKNSTVNQRIQGMMNINGVEGQAGIDYAAIAKSQSKDNLNKSANYYMAVKQAIAEKNKRDLGIGRTSAFDAEMDRKASEFATEFAKSSNSLADNSAVKAVKQDVSEKVSDSNKTTIVSTGEEVSIKKIKSISNGNMELELTNGNTVNSKDIKYKSQDEALVYESVLSMGYSADTANAIVNGYNALTGVSASNYLLGVNEAYNYGRIGYPQESIKSEGFYADLTDAQKRFAYNLGREAAEAETKSAQNAIKKGSNNKTGKVHMTSSMSSMTNRQKASVSAIGRVVADVTHNDVYLYESVEKDGKRVFSKDIAGHKAGEKAPNGFYDPNTGAIFIDINAGNGGEGVMLWTAAHELTHFIRQWSPAKFKVLADFLMEEYGKNGVDIQTLIQDQINKAKRSGRKLSFDGAYEEVVADAMQTMFTDTNLSEKIAKLKAKDQTLWQKIKSFFADLYKRITEAYKGLDPQTDEAKFVRSMKDSIEKLSDMFAEAIVDAGESFSTADATLSENGIAVNPGADAGQTYSTVGGEIDLDGDSNVHKLSDRTMIEGAGLQFIPDEDGTHYTVLDASGNPVKEVTPEEISNSPIGQLVASAKDNGFLGKGKEADIAANKQYKFLAELVNMCINYDGLAPIWETAGTMVFSSIKSNADKQYGLTIDFSTVCKKTQAIVDAMSEAMVRLGRGLTRSEVETIYLEVGKAGESTPCPVCYVFSRWMGIGGILDQMSRFQDKYTHMSEGELQSFIAGIKKRISERANTPNKNGNLNGAFFDKNGAIKEGQVIYDLKQKANSGAGSTLNAITKNSDIQLQIQELKALMDNQDAKEAKKTDNKIKKLESKLVDVTALEKQFKEYNDAVEEYEAYQWLTRTLMEEVGGKWVKNKQFKPVPKDVLFDLNKGAEFAEKYPLSWAFRTGKGASAGKAITPYADARVGEAIQGIASQDVKNIKTGIDLNPFLNGDEKTRQKIIASAIEKQARQNLIGGQRYQSTSDFRYEYGSDYLITFLEMQAIGAKVQLYTKVIEAVDFLASVGADINLSVMPLSDGYVTLPNGKKKLIYSSVTGIDAEAAIKKAHEYNNVQLILVGISDEHIRLALEGDEVTFVIPFHGSGNTVHQIQVLMNLLGENLDVTTAEDYTPVQSDHVSPKQTKEQKAMWDLRVKILTGKASTLSASEFSMLDKNAYLKDLYNRFYVDENADEFGINLSKDVAEQIFPYEYWDKSLTYSEADKNGERFKEYCASMGIIPRFSGMNSKGENVGFGDFTNNKGYWKLLIDRPMYDNTYDSNGNWTGYGKYHEQKRINCSNFQVKHLDPEYGSATYGEVMSKANDPKKTNIIVDRAIAQFENSKLSDRDSEYLELAKNPKKNEKRLRELVGEAAKEAGYTVEGWHGTGSKKFTKFGYGRNGIFITTDEDIANTYGSNVMHLYGTENNQIVIDADGHHFTDIPVPEWIRKEIDDYPLLKGKKDTDTLAKVAKNLGYSSIKIANVSDSFSLVSDTHKLSDVYCYFESLDELHFKNSQVKSADIVTYDDNGNIIPLSQRFNTKNDDIRYSDRDSIESENRILDLENQISDLEDQLADDIFNEIHDSDRKKINNKIWKLRHELEVLENAERQATVKTSLADIRDNLDKYRYIDLRSLAEGFGWEDYEDMTKAQLASAMREYLNDIEEEWKDVESSDFYSERDGMWVRPVSDGEKSGAKILSFPSKGMRYSDRYDAKQRYVDRVMSKNAEVETLSDDQHSALRKVAEMRHKFHSNPDGLFNTESASYDMWNYVAQDGEINRLLEQVGLPTIEFGDYTYTPSTFDYEELGGKDEYETLEEWKEQSGVMDEFYKDFNDANERIEKYLRTIDEEHGTQYAPSGFSRLYSDRDPDATDNRTLLSNALESAAQKDEEKKLLADYKAQINSINEEQKKLTELRAKIKELSFAKGHRDSEQISKLQAEATKTANRISTFDKQLLKLEATKPLKDVIDRERTLAKKKAEKAGKEALSAYREKAAQAQRELMDRYQERIKSGVENRRKHEFVNKIEKIAYDIQYRLEHPSAKTVIPEVFGKSVANFLKALDFTTFDNKGNVREGKANKTRAELRLSISNLADNLAKVSIEADYGQLDISADMLEWLKKMSTMLEDKYKADETFYVRKMNSEELGDLYKLIKSLQTSINQASKFYTNMSSDVESLAYNTIIHLEPLYGKTHNTMLDSVDKLLRWDYAQPITVFDRFGDSGITLMRMLMQGQKTMADNVEAIDNFVQTAYTAEEVNKWREELHKITIQGKTYEVSTAFLMEFHNLLRDPDAKRHILEGGGIRFDDLVIGKKKTRFGDTYVTREEADAIDNELTERPKQVAESLEKFLSEKGADWGNKISMRRFGYHAFGNIENYYPIKTIKAGSEYEARQKRANIYALLNKSFTKERNIHADNAIIVGDVFQTFNDHMSEMALYNAWALPVIDLIKWFNYRETQDVENKISEVSVKEALRQAYGKNADEYIRRLLESINSQKSGGLSESIAFKNLRIVNRVAVSANLRVAIQQPFSITRAMELISPKYVKPLVGESKKNAYNEMVANSSFGKWKSMGYYDVDVSRPLEVKVLKNASFADKITEKSMFLAEAGDNFTWAVLWNACKAEVSEKNKGITNDELIAKTGERFDDIIIRTQVVDSVLTKSQWMRSDSFFHRMTSSFMSESMTSYNTLLRQYDRYSADAARTGKKSALKMNGKPIATTVTVFVLTQLINALVTAPLDAARDDDDYKTFLEKMLEKFKRSALQNLLPTSMMPYIADIVEYAMYGNTDRPDLQLYTKAIDLGKQLKRTIDNYDYFKLHKLINSALSMASSISGIPMSNIARDAIAVWNTVVGNIGNGELKFQTSPDSSSVAYEKMYEAIVNGKTDKATKLYAQMQSNSVSADSINSALTSRVKQDYIDGKIDSDEASRLLKTIAEYTGKELTDDEIYWKIDKWNYEDENGTSDGYAKYDDFLSAVETGNDLRAVIQEYTENGVDKKTLASQITSHFKPIYVGMTRSERASIKGYLLNAYALLGYDRTEKSKDIDNWVK